MSSQMIEPNEETFVKYEKKFKALADQKRLEILHLIQQHQSLCVCDLAEHIDMPQSKLSYHLKQLLDAGFLQVEKKGRGIIIPLEMKALMKCYRLHYVVCSGIMTAAD